MAKVKCRWCGKRIDRTESFIPISCNGNMFYCNEDEYKLKAAELQQQAEEKRKLMAEAKRKRAEENRLKIEKEKRELQEKQRIIREQGNKNPDIVDPVYEAVADIFDRRINNGVLFNEMKLWRAICDDDKILSYLQENRSYIENAISRKSMTEYQQIRYMSAILKNNLLNYNKPIIKEDVKVEINCEMYEPVVSNRRKRRGLSDIEDEV